MRSASIETATRDTTLTVQDFHEKLHDGFFAVVVDVYAACLNLIPHGEFSFSKIWILAAKLEIRAKVKRNE